MGFDSLSFTGPWRSGFAAMLIAASLQGQGGRGLVLRAPVSLPSAQELGRFPSGPLPQETQARLNAALDVAQAKTQAPALTAAVAVPGMGVWTAVRHRNPQAGDPELFYWASVGKAFTAVLILQLVEEGKLSLEASIDRWFPDYPEAKSITIAHLLSHTSGIFSWQEDVKLRNAPGYKTPEALIATARTHPNGFAPGTAWSYSNTGYTMLGLILERLDGKTYAEAVEARILRKLGLKHTWVARPGQPEPTFAPPHPQPSDPVPKDRSLATPFAAGSILATSEDMVRFWHGLITDQLLRRTSLETMLCRLYPMYQERVSFYGLGLMIHDLPGPQQDTWLGHSGGTPGIRAEVSFSLGRRAFAAVALTNNGSAQATMNLLFQVLQAKP